MQGVAIATESASQHPREAMNKRWCSKDNRIEEVVSVLLIPEICCYFVKCRIKILGKGPVH